MFRPAYCSHCSYYLTLLWLAYKLTYIIIQYYLNNALPFNQPWGALNYYISGSTVYIYMGALPNVMQYYLKN